MTRRAFAPAIGICGIGLVTAAITASTPQPSMMQGVPDLTIGGEAERRPQYAFTSISGIAADAQGRIFVVDTKENLVRAYSPAGIHLFDVGRKGQGPGELQEPSTLAFDRGGRLWVRDGGNLRYVAYTIGSFRAEPYATVRMAHTSGSLWAPVAFDSEGRLVDVGDVPAAGGGRHVRVRFHLEPSGKVAFADTIRPPRPDSAPEYAPSRKVTINGNESIVTAYLSQPNGGKWIQAHSVFGDWATGASSGYAIAWMGPSGTRARVISRTIPPPPPVSDVDRKRGEEAIETFLRRAQVPRSSIPFSIPDRKAPLRDIGFDADGRLWVERSVITGTPRIADIFDRSGRFVATVTWPADIFILGYGTARGWTAWGVGADSLGVERMVRLAFR
jgi:hypothetical protein